MRKRRTRLGFTLLELLVVMAVLSVVTTIGATSFIKMTTMWGDTSDGMELNAKSVNVFRTMRSDFERVASAQRTGRSIQGLDRLETDALINRHIPQDDQIIIPVIQRSPEIGWQQLAVMYKIDRSGGVPTLVRVLGENDGSTPSGAVQVVAEQVVAMNITYLDGENTWLDAWSRADLPAAVRVSLSMGLSRHPMRHVTREAVFPIHVK